MITADEARARAVAAELRWLSLRIEREADEGKREYKSRGRKLTGEQVCAVRAAGFIVRQAYYTEQADAWDIKW